MTTFPAELLGPAPSWEIDDGLTMTRKVYRCGVLVSIITFEMMQEMPQMRPFKIGSVFGDHKHRPTQENV